MSSRKEVSQTNLKINVIPKNPIGGNFGVNDVTGSLSKAKSIKGILKRHIAYETSRPFRRCRTDFKVKNTAFSLGTMNSIFVVAFLLFIGVGE